MFRHKSKVVLWCGLVTGFSLAALVMLPRKYASEAKLFLRLGRESVTLDPTATTGATVQVQESRENQINSAREMLKSRSLLERVVERIGPETILNGPAGPAPTGFAALAASLNAALSSLSLSAPVSPAEEAIGKLSDSMDVSVARNSSVINLACTAKTPKSAQQIMEAFLDAYREQHLLANRTAGSWDFFNGQTTQLKRQLDTAMERLRDAKNESSLVSVAAEQQAVQSQLTQVEAAALAADASLASAEAAIASLRQSLTDLPRQLTMQQTAGFPNIAGDSMRQEFFKLQMSVRDMEAKLGEEHPLLKAAREQARQSETILNTQPPDRTQTTAGINPSRQSLDLELRHEEALAASLRAKSGALKEQYAELQQRTRTLNEHEVRIRELERQAAIAEVNYRSYAEHSEQARIGEALEANRISNINVVQPPSLVEKPVSPKPVSIVGLGFLAAVCGALGLAFWSEYLDTSLKTAEEIESQLSVPVLASIPCTRSNLIFLNR
jgi:uncharacterized protein involved in exopolysaccharide biosynthesis